MQSNRIIIMWDDDNRPMWIVGCGTPDTPQIWLHAGHCTEYRRAFMRPSLYFVF